MSAENNEFTYRDSVSLKEYFETQFASVRESIDNLQKIVDERDRLYSTQFKSPETAVNAALAAAEKAVNAAFLASEKAIVKAEDAQKDYNTRSNEFRGQLDDQAKTLMPRPETMSLFNAVDERIKALQQRFESSMETQRMGFERQIVQIGDDIKGLRESRSELAGKGAGVQQSWAILLGVAALVGAVFSIASRFIP